MCDLIIEEQTVEQRLNIEALKDKVSLIKELMFEDIDKKNIYRYT